MPDATSLILTSSGDATADYLCGRLGADNVRYSRFDTDRPPTSVRLDVSPGAIHLTLLGATFEPSDIRAVVFRRPKPFAPADSGDAFQQKHAADEWAEAVEGFLSHIPLERWINHPIRNYAASHKVHQLAMATKHGLTVPSWIVTTDPSAARRFLHECGWFAVAKPLSSGYIERGSEDRDTVIYTSVVTREHDTSLDRIASCPVLFQRRVDKRADVRLVYLDGRAIAVALNATDGTGNQRLDIRRDEMRDVAYSGVTVPRETAEGVSGLMATYGLRFGALDFAIDADGRWVFLEVNPNGQWAWLDQVGACDAAQLFVDALTAKESADVR